MPELVSKKQKGDEIEAFLARTKGSFVGGVALVVQVQIAIIKCNSRGQINERGSGLRFVFRQRSPKKHLKRACYCLQSIVIDILMQNQSDGPG